MSLPQYCETVTILFSIMSKWDDQFDFDDAPQPRANKQDKKNRNSTSNNDFEDLQEQPKNVKLPTLIKNSLNNNDKNAKSNASITLDAIAKRKVEPPPPQKNNKYDEEEYQLEESLAPNPPNVKQKSPKVEQRKAASPPKKEEKVEEDVYGNQQFEQQKYEEDFEAHEEPKPSPAGYRPKQQTKQQPTKPVNVPKPAQQQRKGAESVAKRIEVSKGNSRNSIRSQSATRSAQNSRSKVEQKKDAAPSKYSSLAQKSCPTYERSALQQCNMDRLTRENDKIRGLIKRFNDELNDLINRNIMQLKSKKEEKVLPPEDALKVLEEQRNSNQTALQTTLKELQKLKGKEGELKEEEYHISLDQKITEVKNATIESNKAITKLKLEVNNEGNKLSKIDKEKQGGNLQEASAVKASLISLRKDEQKNDEILQKLYIKYEQLSRKIGEAENRYNSQIEEAKTKGLSVQITPELVKKAQEIKKKIEISRLHKTKTENLFKTKCEMISHQCDQIRLQSKALENSVQACANNCEEIQSQSRKIVERARRSGKISEQMVSTLQTIISQLQNGTPSSNKEKEDTSTFSHPKGAKKYQSQKNVEKVVSQQTKEATQDDASLKKPTLFKKKEKQEQKQDERVWKDDKNNSPKKIEKAASPIPELAKFENKQQVQKKDDEKKKPFVIKRNKETKPQPQPVAENVKQSPKIQKIQPKKQAANNEETPSIAPRMMKFRRNKPQQGTKQQQPNKQTVTPPAVQQTIKEQTKIQQKIQQKQQQQSEKPIFAPKRFNLKLKDRNNEQGAYVATAVQKKQQPKKQQPKTVQQFKPKGLTIDKQPFSLTSQPKPVKAIDTKIPAAEQQQKPKFNLRLRDRQRESNKETKVELPQQAVKQAQAKIAIALDDKSKQNNQYTNPYANAQAPKREREGHLKKQKPVQAVQKQNFNIYEQAQDITNVKQLKIGDSPKVPPPTVSKATTDEPNLHDLLGIKKNQQSIEEDLLVDPALLAGKGVKGKRESRRDTNFFGDLQV